MSLIQLTDTLTHSEKMLGQSPQSASKLSTPDIYTSSPFTSFANPSRYRSLCFMASQNSDSRILPFTMGQRVEGADEVAATSRPGSSLKEAFSLLLVDVRDEESPLVGVYVDSTISNTDLNI